MPRLSEGKKQLTKFAFIGGLAVLTDLACYYLFLQLFPDDAFPRPLDNEAVAKTLSFLCGLIGDLPAEQALDLAPPRPQQPAAGEVPDALRGLADPQRRA